MQLWPCSQFEEKKNQIKHISGKVINLTTTYMSGKYYF